MMNDDIVVSGRSLIASVESVHRSTSKIWVSIIFGPHQKKIYVTPTSGSLKFSLEI